MQGQVHVCMLFFVNNKWACFYEQLRCAGEVFLFPLKREIAVELFSLRKIDSPKNTVWVFKLFPATVSADGLPTGCQGRSNSAQWLLLTHLPPPCKAPYSQGPGGSKKAVPLLFSRPALFVFYPAVSWNSLLPYSSCHPLHPMMSPQTCVA